LKMVFCPSECNFPAPVGGGKNAPGGGPAAFRGLLRIPRKVCFNGCPFEKGKTGRAAGSPPPPPPPPVRPHEMNRGWTKKPIECFFSLAPPRVFFVCPGSFLGLLENAKNRPPSGET